MGQHADSLMEKEEIRNVVSRIAKDHIAPRASEVDRNGTFPREALDVLGKAQLAAVAIAEGWGGLGAGRTMFASIVQEIARACASTALVYVSHVIAEKGIELAGHDSMREKWIPAMSDCKALGAYAVHEPDSGSNAGAISTTARKDSDSFVLNGSKFLITSAGEAGVYLVLVRTDPKKGPQGMSTLLIEKDFAGLSFGRVEDKMGMRGISSRDIFFSDCRVPARNLVGNEGDGMQVIGKSVVGWGFYGAAAISVGIASCAVDAAVKHAKERAIAGQFIGTHQAVQAMITDMILATEAATAYLNQCATKADASPDTAPMNGFKAKLFASEMALDVTNKAIQVLGGHGYCRDYGVERLFRDARGLTLHFKTSEWLRQDIAKAALGL